MAAPEPTGPRRAQRAILLEPLLPEEASHQPGLFAKLSVATSSVNLFTRPVIASDAETLRRGRAKTWIFVGLLTLSSILLISFYAATPTVISGTIKQPTLDDYLSYEQYAPTCPCTRPVALGEAITINITQSLNLTHNACGAFMAVGAKCGSYDVRADAPVNCTQTLAGAMLWKGYLDSISYICAEYAGSLLGQLDNVAATDLGPVLLSPDLFNRTATLTTLTAMQTVVTTASTAFSSIQSGVRDLVPVSLDLSEGSTTQTPPGCTCKAELMGSAMQIINAPCRFRALFDVRQTPLADTWWTCNSALNQLNFPLSLLLRNETYAALSLPPPYAHYMTFLGAGSVTENSSAVDFFFGIAFDIFPSTAYAAADATTLRPGFLTADYSAHFDACSPEECTYTYRGRPSFLAALTTALGVISGLQTVLTLLVDRGYDAGCKRKEPTAGGAAGESVSGVGVIHGVASPLPPPAPR